MNFKHCLRMVDIKGLDKLNLLHNLCRNEPLDKEMVFLRGFDEDDDAIEEAKDAILKYTHRFRGRPIGANLNNDYVPTYYYNRHYGKNAFENIVSKMRNNEEC